MIILVWYYQHTSQDSGWAEHATVVDNYGDPVYAQAADFNGNGRIDLADLVELYINYCE